MIFCVIFVILLLSAVAEAFGSKSLSILGTKGVNSKQSMKYSVSSVCFVVSAVYLWFIVAMRYETVGADIGNYVAMFNTIEHYDFSSASLETGYAYLNLFFHNVFGSFYLMFFVIAVFCCPACYGHIKKRCLFPCFVLCYYAQEYFLTTEMAQTRQWIAMAIICLGFNFVEEKSLIKWTLLIIVAMQFHVTAICAFPLYFTSRITIKPWFGLLLIMVACWMSLFGYSLVWWILNFTVAIGFLPARVALLLNAYMMKETEKTQFGTGLGYLFRIVSGIYVFLLYKFAPKETQNKMYFFNHCIGILFCALGSQFLEFMRLANYYFICGLGFNAYSLIVLKNKFFKKAEWLQAICTLLFLAAKAVITYASCARPGSLFRGNLPYETFLFK